MAEEVKNSNLRLHVSFRKDTEELTDEEFGRLVRWGLDYITGGDPPRPSGREALFVPLLKRYIDTDSERYVLVVEKRREAAMKRWEEAESKRMQMHANASTSMQDDANDAITQNTEHRTDFSKEKENGAVAPKPSRHKHGVYGHVLLEDEQLKVLQREFPTDWKERIQRMDDYCEANGKTYKNYLQAIRNWARRDGKDIDPNTPSPSGLVAMTLRRKA